MPGRNNRKGYCHIELAEISLHVLRLVEMTTGEVLIRDDIRDVSTTLNMTWQELLPRTCPLPGSYPSHARMAGIDVRYLGWIDLFYLILIELL